MIRRFDNGIKVAYFSFATTGAMAMIDRGILFAAAGIDYVQEACTALASYRELMPTIDIAIATRDVLPTSHSFDRVVALPAGVDSSAVKITALQSSPYQNTLFVDTDTTCIEPVDDLFHALERWDVVVAHAPVREHLYTPKGVPDFFPELNTGVLGIRKSNATGDLLAKWEEYQAASCDRFGPRASDQQSFRRALWESELKVLVLPPEYNLRTCFNCFVGGNATVKIIHDRSGRAKEALRKLRTRPKHKHPRVW